MSKSMAYVCACKFKREEKSEYESGFLINESVIIDKLGERPENVWDCKSLFIEGCFHLFESDNNV